MPSYKLKKYQFYWMSCATVCVCIYALTQLPRWYQIYNAPGYILHNTAHVTQAAPPYHGIGVYVIHLDRAKGRLAYVMPSIKKLGLPIHIIHAVDGRTLSPQTIAHVADQVAWKKYNEVKLKTGTIGCNLSHLKAYQAFLHSHYRYALIFEDDVSFTPKKLQLAITKIIQDEHPWDLINFDVQYASSYLYYHSLSWPYIDLSPLHVQCLLATQSLMWNAGCYLINRHAAKRFAETWLPIKISNDAHFRRDWELGIITLESQPALVYQTFGSSDRMASKNLTSSHTTEKSIKGKRNAFWQKATWMRTWYHFKIYAHQRIKHDLNTLIDMV